MLTHERVTAQPSEDIHHSVDDLLLKDVDPDILARVLETIPVFPDEFSIRFDTLRAKENADPDELPTIVTMHYGKYNTGENTFFPNWGISVILNIPDKSKFDKVPHEIYEILGDAERKITQYKLENADFDSVVFEAYDYTAYDLFLTTELPRLKQLGWKFAAADLSYAYTDAGISVNTDEGSFEAEGLDTIDFSNKEIAELQKWLREIDKLHSGRYQMELHGVE